MEELAARLLPEVEDGPSWAHSGLPAETWLAPARAVATRHGLGAGELAPLLGGSLPVVSLGAHVVKFYPPGCQHEQHVERTVQEALAGRLPLATPEPVAAGELDGWVYLVMTRLRGEPIEAVWQVASREQRVQLARELGAMAAALHETPCATVAPLVADWSTFIAGQIDAVVETQKRRGAPAEVCAELEAFIGRHLPLPDPASSGQLLHTELLGDHVRVAASPHGGWQLSGLLDLAEVMVGHPEYEAGAAVEFLFRRETGCLDAYLEGYGWRPSEIRDPERRERLFVWHLLHRYAHLKRFSGFLGFDEVPPLATLRDVAYG